PAMSAVFQDQELLGVTEQLIGTPWLHAKPFHYAGTVAEPLVGCTTARMGRKYTPPREGAVPFLRNVLHPTAEIAELGCDLVSAFGLTGYFGIDFILHDNAPYVIEVNPRYP